MSYQMTTLFEEIHISRIVTIHYYEYMSNFSFQGESHNFWEFLCVDKGEVEVTANRETFTLHAGDMIFHKPNEFHALAANGTIAPNLVVISFDCGDPCMKAFENRLLRIGEKERTLIAGIIAEARKCFEGPLDDPYMKKLTRKPSAPFGSEQFIKLYLEQLLIVLFRSLSEPEELPAHTNKIVDLGQTYESIIRYFESRIRTQLTVDQICKDNLISDSQLKRLFRTRHDCGVIEWFIHMKIDFAKQLIRNRQMNFTQIADYLGYTSVHYFSRQFKKETGMTPTEYTASIMKLAEPPQREL